MCVGLDVLLLNAELQEALATVQVRYLWAWSSSLGDPGLATGQAEGPWCSCSALGPLASLVGQN